MGSGAAEREILEKKLEKRLQDPNTEPLISLPLYFLENITCGFSTERELGRGGCGVVYKGVLRSGKTIAVKKIFDTYLMEMDNDNRVKSEIICFREVRHNNVVQLVGYCVETKSEVMENSVGEHVMADKRSCLLCFEFFCNGSLDKHLSDETLGLDWDKRYNIIKGVCRGLHYLHNKHRIVHRDLKPQNILMDDMMMPKIADFDLSRILNKEKSRIVTANLRGTLGYMAPECIEQLSISFEADIFSLGVIIIEIITGCRDYPKTGERTETSLKRYTDEVVESLRNRRLVRMSPEMHIQQVEQCISIALKCLEPESKKRPTSLDIVQGLDALEPAESGSRGNSPSDPNKDRRNQNLESQVSSSNVNMPKTKNTINSLNECANLFQWVISATSSLKYQWSETQLEKLQGDVRKLQSDHQYLCDSLPRIYDLIDRAEWRIHDNYVPDLLPKLKDTVYDAEDLLDEFRWYETKVSVEGNAISVKPVIEFFCGVTLGGFNKVTYIQKRLDHLSRDLENVVPLSIPRFGESFRRQTTSLPTEKKIFGRNKEKDDLIRLLGVPIIKNSTGPSGSNRKRSGNFVHDRENNKLIRLPGVPTKNNSDPSGYKRKRSGVPVLPIVGIGGVGKTTLTQDICKHSNVKRHFDLIIWICVSDDFNVTRLTKEAAEQSCGEEVPKTDNLNVLQGALKNSLDSKRFLLVLDDIWNQRESDWKQFYAPFSEVRDGSMMLVTTRSPTVAEVVRTMAPISLEGLNDDDFWKFFKLCVFGSNKSNSYPDLERIGEKILPKLKGSPLAAKTLGRLLGKSLDPEHWDTILKSQLWELPQGPTDILPALQLSYMYLPSYLKRCISFCAVYPKDHNFEKEDLVEIWVAEGLVEHQPNIPFQHTGGQYFEELVHLSFFQKHPWLDDEYVIHDLMHDMAQLVSKDECFIVQDTMDIPKIPKNVRHLLVLKSGDVKYGDLLNLSKHRKIRTLLCDLSLNSEIGNTLMEQWCAELLCIRVMICSSISKWGLPGSISNLKHLRYLKILDSSICKSLPSKFCCLYNMQIFYGKKWGIDDIPSGFAKLINLQKFESKKYQFHHKGATSNKEQRRQFKYKKHNGESPPHGFHAQNMPDITSLELDTWDNVKSISSSMNSEQIHIHDSNDNNTRFSFLTDVIIHNCHNLSSLEQFLQPAYMPNIKEINISDCRSLESVPAERFHILRCFEVLGVSHCPMIKSERLFAPSLKRLFLKNSGNLGGNIECSSLAILHLSYCPLKSIELQIWNLPLLQELEISFCRSLTVIRDSELIYPDITSHGGARSRTGRFPKLTHLSIEYCDELETIDYLLLNVPAIKSIKIWQCGLVSVPSPDIISHGGARSRTGKFLKLTNLSIKHCDKLETIDDLLLNLPAIESIVISDCGLVSLLSPDIISHGGARSRTGKFLKLTNLSIRHCDKLETMDDLLINLPAIESIEIWRCGLVSLPANRFGGFPRLKYLEISLCERLNWQSGMVLPPSLQKLTLQDCGDFSDWFPTCLEKLTSLEEMQICDCECVVSVPGLLWSSNLKSLKTLKFDSCPKLKSLGEPHKIAHIKDLYVADCPELKEIDQPLRKGRRFLY